MHSDEAVSSVRFSKNSKYILSSGRDSKAVLWELATGESQPASQPAKAQEVMIAKAFKLLCVCVCVCVCSHVSVGRPLNTYHPSKLQRLDYGPCAVFNHTEDYSK